MTRSTVDRLEDIVHSAELAIGHAVGLGRRRSRWPGNNATPRYSASLSSARPHRIYLQKFRRSPPKFHGTESRTCAITLFMDTGKIDFVIVAQTIAVDLGLLRSSVERLIALVAQSEP